MVEVLLIDVAVGGVAGAVYGGASYFRKREGENPEPFDPYKLLGTVLVGAGVGVALANSGMAVTDNTISDGLMFGATMGFTSLIENAFRAIYRFFKGPAEIVA